MTALRSLDARTDRRLRLRVRGAVQGVGFRPFAYGLASRLALSGFVLNDAEGVLIEVEGAGAEQFLHALRLAPPPLARIDSIDVAELPLAGGDGFAIRATAGGPATTRIGADAAICEECLDRAVRPGEPLPSLSARQLHPLRAALHPDARAALRPRPDLDGAVSDVRGLRARLRRPGEPPLPRRADRLPALRAEAQRRDRRDRRLHPRRRHRRAQGARRLPPRLRRAQRGDGGEAAPPQGARGQTLRRDGRQYGERGAPRRARRRPSVALLESRARPIVLARGRGVLAPSVAPNLADVGLMLAYTPLHWLVLHALDGAPEFAAWRHARQRHRARRHQRQSRRRAAGRRRRGRAPAPRSASPTSS